MRLLNLAVVVIICVLTLVDAFPHSSTNDSLVYGPSTLGKRTLWNVNDLPTEHKILATSGLFDAMQVVKMVLGKTPGKKGMLDPKHRGKVAQWFGPNYDKAQYWLHIYEVFFNMYDPQQAVNDDTYGTTAVGQVHVWNDDYWLPTRTQVPQALNADGKTPWCNLKDKNGKVGMGYFKMRDGGPGMHFCDRAWHGSTLKMWLGASNGGCKVMGNVLNPETMIKTFLGSVILHEYFHYDQVGQITLGHNIIDVAYGPKPCLALKNAAGAQTIEANPFHSVKKSLSTYYNADTWTWFAIHIFWEETCGRTFAEPTTEKDDYYPVYPLQDTDVDPEYTSNI